jgi:hypothetical protein
MSTVSHPWKHIAMSSRSDGEIFYGTSPAILFFFLQGYESFSSESLSHTHFFFSKQDLTQKLEAFAFARNKTPEVEKWSATHR